MRFLGSFLGKKEKTKVHTDKEVSGKCLELLKWRQYLDNMIVSTHYISRKEFMAEIAPYSETMKFFISLEENDILTDYCVKNGFDPDCARDLCQQYEHINEIVDNANNASGITYYK